MTKTLAVLTGIALFAIAKLLFGALARRRAKWRAHETQRAAAQALLNEEWKRISILRAFRRALHLSTVWKAINEHPGTKHLPRAVRRQAARSAAAHAFRAERGLPEIISRGHIRRPRRGYFDPALLMPVLRDDAATVTSSV